MGVSVSIVFVSLRHNEIQSRNVSKHTTHLVKAAGCDSSADIFGSPNILHSHTEITHGNRQQQGKSRASTTRMSCR